MLRQLYRRFSMPLLVIFIMIGVALSMGSSSAQSDVFSNLGATQNGAIGACFVCPVRTGPISLLTPVGADFRIGSITVRADNTLGSQPYHFYLVIVRIINGTVGENLGQTPSAQVPAGQTLNISLSPNPRDYTDDSGNDIQPENTITLSANVEYGIFMYGFLGRDQSLQNPPPEIYGGWKTSATPPSNNALLSYSGSMVYTIYSGDNRTLSYLPPDRHLMLEITPAGNLSFSPAPPPIAEGGASARMTVNANPAPTGAVTVPLNSDGQCEFSTDNVTFAPTVNTTIAADAIEGEFFVRAVDDALYEHNHSCIITMGNATSSDLTYNVLTETEVSPTTIPLTDNEALPPAAITLSQTDGSTGVEEGGATDSFNLRLNSEPTAPVQIAMLTDGQCSVIPTSLIFGTSGFLTPQNVTVTAVNDTLFEANPHNCAISFSVTSSDSRYNGRVIPTLNAAVTDNDPAPTPEFVITETGGSTRVSEAGESDSYSIRMTAPPISSATLAVSTDGQCDIDVTSLSFDGGNYALPRTINVTPVNDAIAEGTHTCTIYYDTLIGNEVANNTVVTVLDDDAAGFTLLQSGGNTTVTEGSATDTFTVRLNTAPGQDVTLALSTDGQCDVNRTAITFNAATYDDVQTVTVSATNDGVFEPSPHGCTILYDVITFDPVYINVEVFNTLVNVNDFVLPPPPNAGVTVTQSGGATAIVEEGATDSFTLQLDSTPSAAVQIAVTTDAQCSAAPTPLTFTAANTAQTVTLTAVDDAVVETSPHACAVSFSVTSTDSDYNGLAVAGFSADVTDNDTIAPPTAGVTITQSGGATAIVEGGATDSFTLQLGSTPSAAVQIAVTTDAQCSAAPTPLTFTAANTAQTVTLTAVDDAVVETSPHACAVSFSVTSTDGDYNGLAVAGFSADVTDNDTIAPPTAGVTITQSGGATAIVEGGATDTLALRLASAPSDTVTIDLTTDGQCAAAPASLLFTTTDYAMDQTVTISAADDSVAEASPHPCVISYAVTSTDAAYNALAVPNTTADVTDVGAPPPTGGSIASLPPPPPTPLCEDHNFSEGGVVRTGVADNLRAALNCRVLYQNGSPTTWLGSDLYTSGAIGSEGVLALGVQQAIDIFSPTGLSYFNGGAVFCLRGDGYLIWLEASGVPRRAEIIGSYRVDEFPGFTCATLFEPGTLVLVSRLPEGVSAP
jgi:hypothetical protein